VTDATDGDLAFLHGFEQSGLRLGRRAVDFVGQNHVGKQRAGHELELALAGLRFSSMTSVPVMSEGIRSGVNWMREKASDSDEPRC
jgi:hypothetical protein